jgi:Rieske Fe-S protein
MNRRAFLKEGCLACLGVAVAGTFLAGCKSMKQSTGTLAQDGLQVPLKDFISQAGAETKYHAYLVVRNDALQYPICVYRFGDSEYTALYMRCSHQGAELQAAGDRLTCPAHGSEFDNKGLVRQGPADNPLRSFPVRVTGETLFIDLKKS